jgi:hypothetical protein
MAELTPKREFELGLDAVTAPAKGIDPSPAVADPATPVQVSMVQGSMPRVMRAEPKESQEQSPSVAAEQLAFQRLRRSAVQDQDRSIPPGSAPTTHKKVVVAAPRTDRSLREAPKKITAKIQKPVDALGFKGKTILDKFVNSLLMMIRAGFRFIARKLVGARSDLSMRPRTTKTSPAPSTESGPAIKPATGVSKKGKYFPQRSL